MIDDLINHAMRLTSEGDYLGASTLWLNLSQTPDLDIPSRCLYLLNERRCRTALGQHEIAERILENIEKIDSDHLFRLEVEYGWIDDLYGQGRYTHANKKSEIFAEKNASQSLRVQSLRFYPMSKN